MVQKHNVTEKGFEITKIVFAIFTLVFLVIGLCGASPKVSGFYRSVFMLSFPLMYEMFSETNKAIKDFSLDYIWKKTSKRRNWHMICCGLIVFTTVFSGTMSLMQGGSISIISNHMQNDEYWGWTFLILIIFIIPYVTNKMLFEIFDFFKKGFSIPIEPRPDS